VPADLPRPLIIAAEGPDGSGKTAALEGLARWLKRKGRRVSQVPWTASPLVRTAAASSGDRFSARFGGFEPVFAGDLVHIVGVDSNPRLRSEVLEWAARAMRLARQGVLRVFALHHGLLPAPGRKLRDGDLSHRAGDVDALLADLGVDLALHVHVHRAHAGRVSAGRHNLVVASAGALVNDGRRDASLLEIITDDGRLEVRRRSVATGRQTLLYEGARTLAGQGS